MSLLEDITSGDPTRVWSSSCAIRTLRDKDELNHLANNLEAIKQKTQGVELGGMVRPNSSHLNFAIRKLEFVKNSKECLCGLYLLDDLYDPEKEQESGNVRNVEVIKIGSKWIDHYQCDCTLCGRRFRVEEREYHYLWWAWSLA